MADFKKFCDDLSKVAKEAAKKTNRAADTASLYVKKKSLEAKLCDRYEDLGRLSYKQLRRDIDKSAEISAKLDEIDALRREIADIDKILKERKEQAEKEKAERAAEKEAAKEAAKAAAKSAETDESGDTAEGAPTASEE